MDQTDAPKIERVKLELKRRSLTVAAIEDITPKMRRITLTGPDLSDFSSPAPDDHVKLFFTLATGETEARDFTPRWYDNEAQILVIDFAIHAGGPASDWAMSAKPGDLLLVGGPRGSGVITSPVKNWLLVGDETALPAIGRRIENAGPDETITLVATVAGPEEQQVFNTQAHLTCHWVHRPLSDAANPAPLLAILNTVPLAPQTYVWIAAEATVAKAARALLTVERGHPLGWTKSSGYWLKGLANQHVKIEDPAA